MPTPFTPTHRELSQAAVGRDAPFKGSREGTSRPVMIHRADNPCEFGRTVSRIHEADAIGFQTLGDALAAGHYACVRGCFPKEA